MHGMRAVEPSCGTRNRAPDCSQQDNSAPTPTPTQPTWPWGKGKCCFCNCSPGTRWVPDKDMFWTVPRFSRAGFTVPVLCEAVAERWGGLPRSTALARGRGPSRGPGQTRLCVPLSSPGGRSPQVPRSQFSRAPASWPQAAHVGGGGQHVGQWQGTGDPPPPQRPEAELSRRRVSLLRAPLQPPPAEAHLSPINILSTNYFTGVSTSDDPSISV